MGPEKEGMSAQVLCLSYVGKEIARIFSSSQGKGKHWKWDVL